MSPQTSQSCEATTLAGDSRSPFLTRYSARISAVFVALLTFGVALVSYFEMFGRASWLMFVEDDFFYYLTTASHFAHGHGSTFGGVTTNGYHPLWFLCLAAVSYLSKTPAELPIKIFLCLAIFGSTIATFALSRKLMAASNRNRLLIDGLSGIVAIYGMHMYCGAMEPILTVPLVLAVALVFQREKLWRGGFWYSAAFGLLLSALFLSRLDSGLLIGLLAIGVVAHPVLRQSLSWKASLGIFVGVIPSAAYLLSNHIFFHDWLPVSGTAKQLKLSHMPSWPAWHSVSTTNCMIGLLALAALILLPQVYAKLRAGQQVLFIVLLTYPFLYLLLISCLSDWRVWSWYLYGLRPALCISLTIFLYWQPAAKLLSKPLATVAVALIALLTIYPSRRGSNLRGEDDMLPTALYIRGFAVTHPGKYAMGDRAGIVGYLLPEPMIQTEGLMMNSDYIKLMREQTPLRQVLKDYGVDYYIASSTSPFDHCFHALEPAQAGPASPHMVADFCQDPVGSYDHGGHYTFIFKLHP